MDMTMLSVPGRQVEAMADPVPMKRLQEDRETTGAALLHNHDENSVLER
jgi:hypothetical protein